MSTRSHTPTTRGCDRHCKTIKFVRVETPVVGPTNDQSQEVRTKLQIVEPNTTNIVVGLQRANKVIEAMANWMDGIQQRLKG